MPSAISAGSAFCAMADGAAARKPAAATSRPVRHTIKLAVERRWRGKGGLMSRLSGVEHSQGRAHTPRACRHPMRPSRLRHLHRAATDIRWKFREIYPMPIALRVAALLPILLLCGSSAGAEELHRASVWDLKLGQGVAAQPSVREFRGFA